MPVHEIDLAILLQHLDDDTFLAEALLFHEVSRFGDEREMRSTDNEAQTTALQPGKVDEIEKATEGENT